MREMDKDEVNYRCEMDEILYGISFKKITKHNGKNIITYISPKDVYIRHKNWWEED